MRKFLSFLLFLNLISNAYAYDKEAVCRSRIEFDTKRAQWGLDLRQEMIKVCGNKNLNTCGQKYIQKINEQKLKDDMATREYFNTHTVDEFVRIIMLTDNISMESAALTALKYDGKTANQVANEMYSKCLTAGR
jgi:hypothetical protein